MQQEMNLHDANNYMGEMSRGAPYVIDCTQNGVYRTAGIFRGKIMFVVFACTANIYNREFNIPCMHAAKRRYSTKIKSMKTFLRHFRENLYPRNIPAIRYIIKWAKCLRYKTDQPKAKLENSREGDSWYHLSFKKRTL